MHVVCPLEFERSSLRAAAARHGWTLHCCGPGPRGVARWAEGAGLSRGTRVVLAGVAGALVADLRPGQCVEAAEVASAEGTWRAPRLAGCGKPVRILCAPAVIGVTADRHAAAAAHGAQAVDLESAPFAREAEARGWDWSVVRGISDGLGDVLPRGIARWTDARGRTRLAHVTGYAIARPWRAPGLVNLGRRSRAAMREVASSLARTARTGGASC